MTKGISSDSIRFKNHKLLTRKEEKQAFNNLKNAPSKKKWEEIRNYIAEHNFKFVYTVAFGFKTKLANMQFSDIVQNGMMGLFIAIDRYDISKDKKFITYAVWWIRQSIMACMQSQECLIKIPTHHHRRIQLEIKKGNYTPEVNTAIELMRGGTSLDKSVSEEKNTKLSDIIEDKNNSSNPDRCLITSRISNSLEESLNKLSSKERWVIESCFGINRDVQNMDEIGVELNVGRESIRIIKRKALKKMKKHPGIRDIFCEDFVLS